MFSLLANTHDPKNKLGVWSLPWRWHILSIRLAAGRGTSAGTCGLDDVFSPISEYWIQHGAIGPLYITSSYSTWIFCRGVSGFATDCPCDVWCRGLTTCLLHVGPPFGNRFFKHQLGCRFDILDSISSFFCILTYAIIYVLIHHIIFGFIFTS